uniref:Cnidarian restricted protein n=1 Tax=Clytia hemisphaerica TaxID=252671 RepID=A0A7M5VAQ3_9CNID
MKPKRQKLLILTIVIFYILDNTHACGIGCNFIYDICINNQNVNTQNKLFKCITAKLFCCKLNKNREVKNDEISNDIDKDELSNIKSTLNFLWRWRERYICKSLRYFKCQERSNVNSF